MGRIAPVRIALEDVGRHGGDERANVTPSRARVSGKRAPEKPGDSAIMPPAARVLMMTLAPPTRAGESESRKTSDEVMRRARIIAWRPPSDSRTREDGGLRKARRSRRKDHECGAVGKRFCDGVRVGFEGVLLGRSEFSETRTAGMCASQWARMSTRPFRSGFGMRKAGRPGAGREKARPYDPRRDGRVPPT